MAQLEVQIPDIRNKFIKKAYKALLQLDHIGLCESTSGTRDTEIKKLIKLIY